MSGRLWRRGALIPLGMTVCLTLAGCGQAGSPNGPPLQTMVLDHAAPPPTAAPDADEVAAPAEEGDEIVRSLGLIASQSDDESFHKGIGEVIVTIEKASKALEATRLDQAIHHLTFAKAQFQAIDVSSLNRQALRAIPLIDQELDQRIAQLEAIKQQAG